MRVGTFGNINLNTMHAIMVVCWWRAHVLPMCDVHVHSRSACFPHKKGGGYVYLAELEGTPCGDL